jgi:two-component system chemotaxis sensor kinase CheA
VPILNVADLLKSSSALASVPADLAPERKKTILLAEDSIISRMLLKSILETNGYVVKTAVDGEWAWDAMQKENFDAVITDIEMPRLSGLELTARIRHNQHFSDTPVILVTGLASPEDRVRGLEVGANAYIAKNSFEQSDLLEALRRVV